MQRLRGTGAGAAANAPGTVVVSDLSLSVALNECFGLLGPNGAGKSTTLGILTGEIPATSGQADILGFDVVYQRLAAFAHVGYCPQFDALVDDMTVYEHLWMYAVIRGVQLDVVVDRYGWLPVIPFTEVGLHASACTKLSAQPTHPPRAWFRPWHIA